METASLDHDRRAARTFIQLLGVSVPILGALLYFGIGMRRAARQTDSLPPVTTSTPGTQTPPAATTPTPPPAPTAPATVAPSLPAKADPPPDDEGLTIGLLARRRCYVSATVDGRKVIEQLLPDGDQRTIDVKREMVLTAGDAAAIALTLNGEPARPLGKNGEVVTVRVNLSNFKDYLSTR